MYYYAYFNTNSNPTTTLIIYTHDFYKIYAIPTMTWVFKKK